MKKVIIINGSGGKGKDKFVECVSHVIECLYDGNVKNISTVDIVKDALEVLGWDGESKTEKDRLAMSELKHLSLAYNSQIYDYIIDNVEDNDYDILFIHCREPIEIRNIITMLSPLDLNLLETLLVKSNRVKDIKSNISDGSVENFNYDNYIFNDGTLCDLMVLATQYVESTLVAGE